MIWRWHDKTCCLTVMGCTDTHLTVVTGAEGQQVKHDLAVSWCETRAA
jgi:hypothetical protein